MVKMKLTFEETVLIFMCTKTENLMVNVNSEWLHYLIKLLQLNDTFHTVTLLHGELRKH